MPQRPELSQLKARSQKPPLGLPDGCGVPSLPWGSQMGVGCQGLGPSSVVFHKQGTIPKVEPLGHDPVPTWNAAACRWKISLLTHHTNAWRSEPSPVPGARHHCRLWHYYCIPGMAAVTFMQTQVTSVSGKRQN